MTEFPLSIVIPARNRAARIERTLTSVASQSFRPIHVILVDNNSTDRTYESMQRWARKTETPDFRVDVLSEAEPGAANARNAGLREVDTPWVMFFDSDDTMAPNHVELAMDALRCNPEADIIGWDVVMHGIARRPVKKPFDTSDPLYYGVQLGTMATLRYMCRSELVRKAGGWDPQMRGWDDIELGTRLLTCRESVKVVKRKGKPTVDIDCHADSITGSDFTHHLPDLCRACRSIYMHLPVSRRYIALLKLAILAALVARETGGTDHRPKSIMKGVEAAADGSVHRMLLRGAYVYTRSGGRGIARLLHKLFRP